MDIQYYRKFKPRRFVRSALEKFWKRKLLRWSILLGVPLLLFATFNSRGVLQRIRLEEERAQWQQKLHDARQENERLRQLSRSLDNDTAPGGTIEKIAREKYGMVREGETVYKVKKEK